MAPPLVFLRRRLPDRHSVVVLLLVAEVAVKSTKTSLEFLHTFCLNYIFFRKKKSWKKMLGQPVPAPLHAGGGGGRRHPDDKIWKRNWAAAATAAAAATTTTTSEPEPSWAPREQGRGVGGAGGEDGKRANKAIFQKKWGKLKTWWSDFYCRLIRSKRGDREESGEGVVDEVPFSFWNLTKLYILFFIFLVWETRVFEAAFPVAATLFWQALANRYMGVFVTKFKTISLERIIVVLLSSPVYRSDILPPQRPLWHKGIVLPKNKDFF